MADISDKLRKIRKMVDHGEYFTINRPRQYGKTTTLNHLAALLEKAGDYLVFNISFEGIGDDIFKDERIFSQGFVRQLTKYAHLHSQDLGNWLYHAMSETSNLQALSELITKLIHKSDKKVVLLVDEVDKSSNNQLFVSFLGMLRNKYLERKTFKTFQSVILAGVHDVKTLKIRLRPEDEKKYNSPWNIAADFKVNMNLLPSEIKPMLDEYVADTGVVMDTEAIANQLFYYTSGYPFLVSKLCKVLDEEILPHKTVKEWTVADVEIAFNQLVGESNTNFESLIQNLENNEDLYQLTKALVIDGRTFPFDIHDPIIHLGYLYGIFSNDKGLHLHNRLYREVIVNYMTMRTLRTHQYISTEYIGTYTLPGNRLDMERVLTRFQAFMRDEYSKNERDFLERNGGLVFLAFLKPILNGAGYTFKEPQISEERRLDVAITFYQHKYVVELKIWHGEAAHQKGVEQWAAYLKAQQMETGFLVIFDHRAVKSCKQ